MQPMLRNDTVTGLKMNKPSLDQNWILSWERNRQFNILDEHSDVFLNIFSTHG